MVFVPAHISPLITQKNPLRSLNGFRMFEFYDYMKLNVLQIILCGVSKNT